MKYTEEEGKPNFYGPKGAGGQEYGEGGAPFGGTKMIMHPKSDGKGGGG